MWTVEQITGNDQDVRLVWYRTLDEPVPGVLDVDTTGVPAALGGSIEHTEAEMDIGGMQ
jgi:hypothetical protein